MVPLLFRFGKRGLVGTGAWMVVVCAGVPSDEAEEESVRAIAGAVRRDGDWESAPCGSSSGIVMCEVGGCSSSIFVLVDV